MQVRDAETGEWLVIPALPSPLAPRDRPSAPWRATTASAAANDTAIVVLPPIGSTTTTKHRKPSAVPQPHVAHDDERPSNNGPHAAAATAVNDDDDDADDGRVYHPETQSMRAMGDGVGWEVDQAARVERAEERFRTSLEGLRRERARSDLTADARQGIEIRILELMKQQYAEQVRRLVTDEMQRELAREVALRMEPSALGRERLRKRHAHDRDRNRARIERIRAECEMRLAATMAQYNLLR